MFCTKTSIDKRIYSYSAQTVKYCANVNYLTFLECLIGLENVLLRNINVACD